MAGYISIPPVDTLGLAFGRRCRFGREGACGYDPCLLCQRGWGRLGSLESGVVLCKCSRKTFCASVLVKPSLVKPIGSLRSGRHQAPTPSAEHPRAQLSSWAPDGHLQCRPWTAPAAVAVAGIAAAVGAAGVVAGESATSPWSYSLMKKLYQVVDPAGLIIWAMPVGLANWYMLGGEGSLTRALTSHPSSIVAQVSTLPVSTLASQCHGYLAPGQAST